MFRDYGDIGKSFSYPPTSQTKEFGGCGSPGFFTSGYEAFNGQLCAPISRRRDKKEDFAKFGGILLLDISCAS